MPKILIFLVAMGLVTLCVTTPHHEPGHKDTGHSRDTSATAANGQAAGHDHHGSHDHGHIHSHAHDHDHQHDHPHPHPH
ncbi:hypothetical protein B7P43_G06539 [Cryptotermes secundus]|uniref:Uncharacterized protein n=1 Tax=Cryptotermes secundus TaxID=105785 RepID=A0A2J7RHE4_9NEOP|nr:hypothetical protein B7P43_G06539 [Cryptotermes secundus]